MSPLGYTPQDFSTTNPNTITGALGALSAPTLAQDQLQFAQYQQQLGTLGPGLQQAQDQASLSAGFNLGQLGITREQQALQQQGTTENYQLQQQAFQQQAQENQFNYQNQLQTAIGGAAASGVLGTTAAQRQQGIIGQEAQFASQNLQRQVKGAAGDYARAQQNYQLMAQSNGISQQEVYARLQEGLQQMGINADPTQLISQMAGGISAANQSIAAVLMQAGMLTNTNVAQGLSR
jgi:hypothetical protein